MQLGNRIGDVQIDIGLNGPLGPQVFASRVFARRVFASRVFASRVFAR